MKRADETEVSVALDRLLKTVQAAKALADAAVAWWEDHDRQDCHYCGPIRAVYSEDWAHDNGCPVGDYVRALEEV